MSSQPTAHEVYAGVGLHIAEMHNAAVVADAQIAELRTALVQLLDDVDHGRWIDPERLAGWRRLVERTA